MNIPNEAIEAAESAALEAYDSEKDWQAQIRAAIEAAAPILMAQAWDEGSDAEWGGRGKPTMNPYTA